MNNWNAAGTLLQSRIFPGTAHRSVFIYVAGGADGMGDPLTSVERLTR